LARGLVSSLDQVVFAPIRYNRCWAQHLIRLFLVQFVTPGVGCFAEMGAVVYSSGMCMDCYKEYLENAGGQLQGHNPPAYTRGLLKAKQVLQPPTTQGFNE